jgi:hypothetical protein
MKRAFHGALETLQSISKSELALGFDNGFTNYFMEITLHVRSVVATI